MIMERIFKYGLETIDEQTLDLPRSAIFISVAAQEDHLVLYALIDDEEKETRSCIIRIVGTGMAIPDLAKCEFQGTVPLNKFVWHIFEKKVKI
jgi:hypothetical protein